MRLSFIIYLYFSFLSDSEAKSGRLVNMCLFKPFGFYILCFNIVFPLDMNLSVFFVVRRIQYMYCLRST